MEINNIHEFIKKRPQLVWYVRDLNVLSDGAIVEAVLNYGNWDDVKELIRIIGVKKTADIFNRQIRQKRVNYDAKILNYFKLYFSKYA